MSGSRPSRRIEPRRLAGDERVHGGPDVDRQTLAVQTVEPSPDGMTARLKVAGL